MPAIELFSIVDHGTKSLQWSVNTSGYTVRKYIYDLLILLTMGSSVTGGRCVGLVGCCLLGWVCPTCGVELFTVALYM